MKIYSALRIGEFHLDHCEDYLYIGEIGNNKIICAVMDGCSMGTDSYFIATLVGKLLRKIAKEKRYKEHLHVEEFSDPQSYLKSILKALFDELKIIKGQLMLDKYELLTTLMLLIVDVKLNQGIIMVVGDGLVQINGKTTEFNQDNQPDYLGYHLSEEFEDWYQNQGQKISFTNLSDVSISTDGIFTFARVKLAQAEGAIDPINYLLSDNTKSETGEMLNWKLKELEDEFGLRPRDDLAIIRLIV